ncbi:MAG: hypothetical protein U0694_06620 [Anaerolineae bacterium]
MMLVLWAALTTAAAVVYMINGGNTSVALPLAVIWVLSLLAVVPQVKFLRSILSTPLHLLRKAPALLWLLLLLYTLFVLLVWFKVYEPVWGKTPDAGGLAFLGAMVWLWWFVVAFGLESDEGRAIGAKLGKSRLTGVLITLTTLALLLVGTEGYLRVFMVKSDGFAFTIMHYWWREIYWRPINSLGYRDYEPHDDPTQQHILVVGDSFPSGHGINNIDDTFPQVLDRTLDGYTVNIAAQPGWDTNVEFPPLQNYPVQPNIVILSHYFNDLGYALSENPVRVTFPDEPLRTFVDSYFLPSFLYWHIFQFGIEGHAGEYVNLLLDAYNDPTVWAEHQAALAQFVTWANEHDARLIVIVWPALDAIAQSAPASTRVTEYFEAQGVTVVNMDEALQGRSTAELVVNPFDAHPNAAVHALAAQLLANAVQSR